MKKLLIIFLIAILVMPLGVVFAGEPMIFELEFRNQTGAMVGLDMVDANGNHIYTDVPQGVSNLDVLEGKYSYYAVTACGVEVGTWNMNVKKVAIFKCEGKDNADLFIDLDRYCYWPGWPVLIGSADVSAQFRLFPMDLYPDNFTHTNGCWRKVFN